MFSLLITVVFFGIGVLLFFIAHNKRKKAKAAQTWPSVPGQVVESRIEQFQKQDENDKWYTAWRPQIVYNYAVSSRPFQGNLTSSGYSRQQAEQTVARYPVGCQMPVFYNPLNPAEAMLERTSATGYIFMYILAGVFILVSGLAFLMAIAFMALRSKGQ
jgi:heme/copper-type cytochrome/quinol oxidase subunit 2